MPADHSTPAKRRALTIALVYLLIRGIPDLLLYLVVGLLPGKDVVPFMEQYAYWLQHLFAVLPLRQFSVPSGFQDAFASLLPLLFEVILVFLFSAWFLRRGPRAAAPRRVAPWGALILVTLAWSVFARLQLLHHFRLLQLEELRALQDAGNWMDTLPPFLMKAYWSFSALLYGSTPLWALPPVCAHFWFAGRRTDTPQQGYAGDAGTPAALQRAVTFAAFMLGFLILHTALTLSVHLGLWPWAVELSGTLLPRETLEELGLPLTLSQIVFAAFSGALAAYLYTRRRPLRAAVGLRTFAMPVLMGMMAYLLTNLILLALAWLASFALPGLAYSTLRDIERGRQDAMLLLVGINLLSLLVLCVVSGKLGASPRRWSGVALALAACAAVPAYVGWTLTATNMGMAGDRPGEAVTGKLGDARWRSMEQWCTGVVETRHGTWLIGRMEVRGDPSSYVPEGTPDLSELVYPNGQDERLSRRGLFGSRPYLTTLARLRDDGNFELEATIPDVACMAVAPESDTLYLLTGVKTPPRSEAELNGQDAVFRSTDHGASWEWLASGFMAETGQIGWNIKPVFGPGQDVWAWGKEPPSGDEPESIWGTRRAAPPSRLAADGTEVRPTALFYSADGGQTATAVHSPEPLVAPESYLRDISGSKSGDFSGRRDMDKNRFVVQTSATRAYAWVSETMWYREGEEGRRLLLNTRAILTRASPQDEWQVAEVKRIPHEHVVHASTSADGRTYAILRKRDGEWLARLDTDSGEWVEPRALPTVLPGWMARDEMSVRYFWNNGDYQVVSLWGDVVMPRLLLPFSKDPAEISTDAHYYTRDGGRTWHQLAIPDYLGVMGLSQRGSKLYWTAGNWYSDDEPVQRHYDLAQ